MFECTLGCGKKFTRSFGLKRHILRACPKRSSHNETRQEKTSENVETSTNKMQERDEDGPPDPKQRKLTDFFLKDTLVLPNEDKDSEEVPLSQWVDKINERLQEEEKKKEVQVKNKDQATRPACPHCKKSMHRRSINRHIKESCPVVKKALAPVPNVEPAREVSYDGHMHAPDTDSITCTDCGKTFTRSCYLTNHKRYSCKAMRDQRDARNPILRRGQVNPILQDDVFQTESAFHKYLTNYQIMNKTETNVVSEFLESKRETIKKVLASDLRIKTCLKFSLDLETLLEAPDGEITEWTVKNVSAVFLAGSDADEAICDQFNRIKHRIEEEMLRGSGWKIIEILNLMMKTSKYEPLKGSSFLPLPTCIANRKAVINPRNFKDEMCFKYAILASLHQGINPEYIPNLEQYENQFNWEGLTFPVPIHDVKIFERNNPGTSVSVYAIDEDNIIVPVKFEEPKARHVDLLLVTEKEMNEDEVDGDEEEDNYVPPKQHYTYIHHFSRLFASQISLHQGKKHICKRCLTHHSTLAILMDHKKYCAKTPLARVKMPKSKFHVDKDGEIVEDPPTVTFNQPQHSCSVPVRVYADSEALLIPSQGPSDDPSKSSSKIKQHHVPMSFGYLVVSDLPEEVMDGIPLTPQVIRDVENPTKQFLDELVKYSKKMKEIYKMTEPIAELTPKQQEEYDSAQKCYMCDLNFTQDNDKVRDHCHVSGKYRGPAHKNCNINAKNPNFIPVYLHNNSHYDGHFIIRQLGDIDCKIKVIPNTSENMITFSIIPTDGIEIRFLDSFRFMATSLENLANNLSQEMFIHVEKHFGSEHMDLLRRKGVFCYDYVDNLAKLKESRLPPQKAFYSKLYESDISKADYKHACNVFNTFKCKNLGEYSDLYLKLDVLILADVFEAFRQVCFKTYHLDPCWYYTCPGLAWDAALRHTKIELDLIQDEEMLLMIEKGIRGGVAQCIKRYAKARNGYINKEDDKYKDFLAYLDANNLYGWAMSQLLPEGDFCWELPDRFRTKKDIMDIPADGRDGFIFEVDLHYPENLHDKHKDLPFLPETRVPPGGKHPKLLTTLFHKEKYVVHYRLLQQALKHGLELVKVHRVISFTQTDWLKKYIMLNTEERKKATNAFQKDFYKLMNNAVFGKTMEQVRNRINFEVVNNVKRLRKLIRSPFFKDRIIYDETLCAVLSQKKSVLMNKPIYVGMCILDLSKLLMYEFHYETMVPRYGAALSLCYMDTDSYIYFISGVNFYEETKKHLQDFDTSDYPVKHELFNETNKKVLGKFKDEANSVPVEVFVGLKAKMYSLKYGGKVMKRAKGVKSHALRNKIGINDYISCLKNNTVERVSFLMIRSEKHVLFTKEVNKVSLTAVDDKRFILPNLVDTLPHGHFLIPFYMESMAEDKDMPVNTDHIELVSSEPNGNAVKKDLNPQTSIEISTASSVTC